MTSRDEDGGMESRRLLVCVDEIVWKEEQTGRE